MRRAISALWLAAALLLSGCGGIEQSGVEPGDGPAASETEYHGPIEGEPGDDPSEEPSPLQDTPNSAKSTSTATASKLK
jgi:hypothetical protein